jgi:hypothetical protein
MQGGFEKLLTHEMAHRLHIRILDGSEEAMGPVWFYGALIDNSADFMHNAVMETVRRAKRPCLKGVLCCLFDTGMLGESG